jgi:hypothetical protein
MRGLSCGSPREYDQMVSTDLHVNTALIGYTGFVGSNLRCQFQFDHLYNSANVNEIEGRRYDLIVCAGLPGLKWLANQKPDDDQRRISYLKTYLRTVSSRSFVLISTTDVYPQLIDVDERFDCKSLPNHPYGRHRLEFEHFALDHFENVFVVRLPGLFGPSLKKNVLYDLVNDERLEFINPESVFQWYDLTQLWLDITRIMDEGIQLLNLVTEPVETSTIISRCFAHKKVGNNPAPAVRYDVKTVHSKRLAGCDHYLTRKEEVVERIARFILACSNDQLNSQDHHT